MYQLQKHIGPLKFVLFIVLAIVIGVYIVKPLGSKAISDLKTELTQLSFIKTHKNSLSLADSLKSLELASEKSTALITAVPQDGRASYILDQFLKTAEADSLTLSDINSLDEVNHGNYLEYPFNITIQGLYPHLLKYLVDLENKNMVVIIRRLGLQAENMHKKELDINFELSAFVLTGK